MKEVNGDFWYYPADWKLIPTNGITTNTGRAVMGAGLARQARDRFIDLDKILGRKMFENPSRRVHLLGTYIDYKIFSFQTKYDWKELSKLELIEESCEHLLEIYNKTFSKPKVLLPRVGCGLGGLEWKNVKPVLEKYLISDNFIIVSQ